MKDVFYVHCSQMEKSFVCVYLSVSDMQIRVKYRTC